MEQDIITTLATEFPQTAVLVYFIWTTDKRSQASLEVMQGMVTAMLKTIRDCCNGEGEEAEP